MSNPPSKRLWPIAALALLATAILLWWVSRPKPSTPAAPVTQSPRESKASGTPSPTEVPPPPSPPSLSPSVPAERVASANSALTEALALPDPQLRAREFGRLFQLEIARDLDAALAFVRQMARGTMYSQALMMVVDALSRRDMELALKVAAELAVSREDRGIFNMLFDRMARENVTVAVQRLTLVPPGDARENAIRALTDVWARADSAAALTWAQQLPEAADRNPALEAVLFELTTRDPRAAIELARKSLTNPSLDRVLSHAFQMLTSSDPAGASKMIAALPPGDLQTMLAANVARALAVQNVDTALEWIKTLPIDYTRWIALNGILTAWAQKDPTAAARYVLDMPTGQGQEFAASQLAATLAANPRDAIAWAEALPTDGARASAFNVIASTWAQRAPGEATRWAASLRETPQLANAVTGAYSYWLLLDPAAAEAWLKTADLPAETRASLLRR